MAEKVIFEFRSDQVTGNSCCGGAALGVLRINPYEIFHSLEESPKSKGVPSMKSHLEGALELFERIYKDLYKKDAE